MDLQDGSSELESSEVPPAECLTPLQTCNSQTPLPPPNSSMPEPPEEPLQSDCCGTGCTPCVFDIYQADLDRWKELAQLPPEERAARLSRGRRREAGRGCSPQVPVALSIEEYREFEVVEIEEECADVFVYKFCLPPHTVLGVGLGQHMTLR